MLYWHQRPTHALSAGKGAAVAPSANPVKRAGLRRVVGVKRGFLQCQDAPSGCYSLFLWY